LGDSAVAGLMMIAAVVLLHFFMNGHASKKNKYILAVDDDSDTERIRIF
jgi:hypothetical protein